MEALGRLVPAAGSFKKEVVIWNKRVFGHITPKKKRRLARITGSTRVGK